MRPRRIHFAVALCAALAACDSPRTELEPKDIASAAGQLESIAGEARWLAAQLREHAITRSMAWVDQQALAEDAGKAAADIAKPAPPALAAAQERVAMLGARLQVQVPRIAPAAERPDELDTLQADFQSLRDALHALAGPA